MFLAEGLKGEIVSILCDRFPLRVSEIQEILFFLNKKKGTKQAIHKVLKQLTTEGVVRKNQHAYQLDPEFITRMDREVTRLKERYFSRRDTTFAVPPNSRRSFSTNSLIQHDNLWNAIITEKINSYPPKKYPYLQHVPHAWFSLSNTEAEIQVTDLITQKCDGFYTLVDGNNAMDRWIARFYQVDNSYYTTRPTSEEKEYNHQYAIIGSYILDTHYPHKLANRLNHMFEVTQNLGQINLHELIALVNMPAELTITLWNDRRRAARLSNKILAFWK